MITAVNNKLETFFSLFELELTKLCTAVRLHVYIPWTVVYSDRMSIRLELSYGYITISSRKEIDSNQRVYYHIKLPFRIIHIGTSSCSFFIFHFYRPQKINI